MNQNLFLTRRRGGAENAALVTTLTQKISASPRLRVNLRKATSDV
jgi:hypothetical protein